MKFLSKKQSETMKQAYEKKLFDRYWHIVSVLDRASERLWLSLWNKMQKPQFLRGDEAYILSYGFRYDQDKKDLVSISEAEIGKILRNVYSTWLSATLHAYAYTGNTQEIHNTE